MQLLGKLFDFYLDASVHVALAVGCLVGVTAALLNIPITFGLLAFTILGTIVCYNFVKYGVEAEKYLIVTNIYHKYIQIFSFLCFLGAFYFFFGLERKIWVTVFFLGLISTLYAVPFLPNARNLRSLGGLKIYIVAAVWTGFTVLLPVMDANMSILWDVRVLCIQRFILVIILLLPFEIRDLQWDDTALRTLPQIIGIQRTKRLGMVLTIFFVAMTFLKDDVTLLDFGTRLSVGIVLFLSLVSKGNYRTKYFVSFWVEGIPVFWYGLILLVKSYF